jgi:hypothetical protein
MVPLIGDLSTAGLPAGSRAHFNVSVVRRQIPWAVDSDLLSDRVELFTQPLWRRPWDLTMASAPHAAIFEHVDNLASFLPLSRGSREAEFKTRT